MKRHFLHICAVLAALLALTSCKDRLEIYFTDYYVAIKSESGLAVSTVMSFSDNFVVQYPVTLVSPKRTDDLVVTLELVPGDGLQPGVDYTAPSRLTVTFGPDEYKKYFRINYLKHDVDPSKDNTLTIRLVSASDPSLIMGYPGPSKKFSTHVVTKINDD